jgi:hypothetical protein
MLVDVQAPPRGKSPMESINQSISFIVPQNKSMKVKKKNKQKLCETKGVSREAQELISRRSFIRSDNKINSA